MAARAAWTCTQVILARGRTARSWACRALARHRAGRCGACRTLAQRRSGRCGACPACTNPCRASPAPTRRPRTPIRPAPLVHAGQACATDDGRRQKSCPGVRLDPGARRRGRPYRRPCFGLARPGVRQAARQCRGFAAAFHGGTSMACGYSGPALRGRAFATARASGAQARSLTPSGGGCGAASAGVRGRRGCRSGWWTGSCGPAASAGRAGRRRG